MKSYVRYDKSRIRPLLLPYCPSMRIARITSLSGAHLRQSGKRLILLDVDNTLLPWKSTEIPSATFEWISHLRAHSLELCILSNTRHPKRLAKLANQLGIEYIIGKKKPNPAIYLEALTRYGVQAREAVMIGDQLFTDILGANRAGIEGVLVDRCANIDFVATRLLRGLEFVLLRSMRSAIVAEENS